MPHDRPLSELFAQNRPLRSLEFFPPKDDTGVDALRATATALKRMAPDFVSVTYGAGGTTRDRTAQVCDFLKRDFGFTVMPHLTCVGHSRAELSEVADRIYAGGFRNIMTLRGDPPKGETTFTPGKDGLRYASDLVALLKSRHPDFCLGVGSYPQKHPEAPSLEADLTALKIKIDAGADFITTQLFFDYALTIASSINAARPALRFRSCPALCPCSRCNKSNASPRWAARRSRRNSARVSKSPPKIPTSLKPSASTGRSHKSATSSRTVPRGTLSPF